MLTVSQMRSFFMIFFGSIKMKATISSYSTALPNVSEGERTIPLHLLLASSSINCFIIVQYPYVVFLPKSHE